MPPNTATLRQTCSPRRLVGTASGCEEAHAPVGAWPRAPGALVPDGSAGRRGPSEPAWRGTEAGSRETWGCARRHPGAGPQGFSKASLELCSVSLRPHSAGRGRLPGWRPGALAGSPPRGRAHRVDAGPRPQPPGAHTSTGLCAPYNGRTCPTCARLVSGSHLHRDFTSKATFGVGNGGVGGTLAPWGASSPATVGGTGGGAPVRDGRSPGPAG